MGKTTKIGWTHHTFNIVWGCSKVSEGCWNCYAETWAARCGMKLWGTLAPRRTFGDKHWNEPRAWNKAAAEAGERRRVFCSSMADVFEDHPTLVAEREKLWQLIEETPWLDWLLVTKRPENVDAMMPARWRGKWPHNVWLGFTGENQKRFDDRWVEVENVGRANQISVLFCSMEPMLERIDIEIALDDECDGKWLRTLDWLIIGGESGGKARPFDVEWLDDILDQLDGLDVPVFVKQLGSNPTRAGAPLELDHPKGEDPHEWPSHFCRREFPKAA